MTKKIPDILTEQEQENLLNQFNLRYITPQRNKKMIQVLLNSGLRHAFATDLLRETRNIRIVPKALGHSDISLTQIYTHIVNDELEKAMKWFRNRGKKRTITKLSPK